jgi:hypothetical protein
MSQEYSNPNRANDPHALPDVEVFYVDGSEEMLDEEGDALEVGWYWWSCFPGCMPDGEPSGPFETHAEAVADAQEGSEEEEEEGERLKCDKCQMLSINGMACHELGCPNASKDWVDGEWVKREEDEDEEEPIEDDRPELWLCADCVIVCENGHADDITDERQTEIEEAIEALQKDGKTLASNNSEDEGRDEFSSSPCDCCGSRLGGSRERYTLI